MRRGGIEGRGRDGTAGKGRKGRDRKGRGKKEGKVKKGDLKETERGREWRPLHFTFMAMTLERAIVSLLYCHSFHLV